MLLIFDVDGVLVKTSWEVLFEAYQKLLAVENKDYKVFFEDLAAFKKWWTVDWRENSRRLGLSDLAGANKIFYETVKPHIYFLPQFKLILRQLSKKHRLAVLTSRHRHSVMVQLKPVAKYFKIILGAEDVIRLKPHPEGINWILIKTETHREEAVMIGDRPEDMLAGKSAGIKTAAVIWQYGLGEEEEMLKLNPDFILRTFADFLKFA